MNDHEKDWLDDHLASEAYTPDAGFSARVMARLPKTRRNTFRTQILLVSAFCSLALAAVLIGPLTATIGGLATYLSADKIGYVLFELRQPWILYSAEVFSVVATLALLPFLRRWS